MLEIERRLKQRSHEGKKQQCGTLLISLSWPLSRLGMESESVKDVDCSYDHDSVYLLKPTTIVPFTRWLESTWSCDWQVVNCDEPVTYLWLVHMTRRFNSGWFIISMAIVLQTPPKMLEASVIQWKFQTQFEELNCDTNCRLQLLNRVWTASSEWHLLTKNSAVCVRTWMVNVNTFSTTVKDEISEGQ